MFLKSRRYYYGDGSREKLKFSSSIGANRSESITKYIATREHSFCKSARYLSVLLSCLDSRKQMCERAVCQ